MAFYFKSRQVRDPEAQLNFQQLESTLSAGLPSAPSGPAGGDLTGTYPNPTIALLAVTDTKVAVANKDGLAGVPSMRTLGSGALQAMPGNTVVGGTTAYSAIAKFGVE